MALLIGSLGIVSKLLERDQSEGGVEDVVAHDRERDVEAELAKLEAEPNNKASADKSMSAVAPQVAYEIAPEMPAVAVWQAGQKFYSPEYLEHNWEYE